MKHRLIWIFLSLLGLTAASACDGMSADEYGSPYVLFSAKGRVTDAAGRGIPGIRVDADYPSALGGRAFTSEDGTFDIFSREGMGGAPCDGEFVFCDVDGDANGRFVEKTISRPLTEADEVANTEGGWCRGAYEITDVNVTLDEKP